MQGMLHVPILQAAVPGPVARNGTKAALSPIEGPVYGQAGMLRFHLQHRPAALSPIRPCGEQIRPDAALYFPNLYSHLRSEELTELTEAGLADFSRVPPLYADCP